MENYSAEVRCKVIRLMTAAHDDTGRLPMHSEFVYGNGPIDWTMDLVQAL